MMDRDAAGIAETALAQGNASPPSRPSSAGVYEISTSGSASPTSFFARPATPQKSALAALRQSPPNRLAMHAHTSPFKTPRHPRAPANLSASSYAVARTLEPDDLQAILDMPVLSTAQKELAVRVFNAAQRLRDWCREVEDWGWTGRWEDFSSHAEHDETASVGHGNSDVAHDDVVYRLADRFERISDRLDTISENLKMLDTEELKEHVLGIHLARSRPGSAYSSQSSTTNKLELYNEFELFVTQGIIQGLPHLEVLRQALRTWSMRLVVLKELPTFLADLRISQRRMRADNAHIIHEADRRSSIDIISTLELELHASLDYFKDTIPDLGARLDRMLDALEGGDDEGTFPDHWIDDFEALESDYGVHAAEAQNRLLELEILQIAIAEDNERSPSSGGLEAKDLNSLAQATASTSSGARDDQEELCARVNGATTADAASVERAAEIEPMENENAVVQSIPMKATLSASQFDGPNDGRAAMAAFATALDASEQSIHEDNLDENIDKDDTEIATEIDSSPTDPQAGISDRLLTFDPHSTVIRRASVASVESVKRGQVKKLNIKRSSGLSAMSARDSMDGESTIPSLPSTPLNRHEPSWYTQASSPLSDSALKDEANLYTVDAVAAHEDIDGESNQTPSPGRRSMSSASSMRSEPSSPSDQREDSPSARKRRVVSKLPKPPLNGLMHKKRQSLPQIDPTFTSFSLEDNAEPGSPSTVTPNESPVRSTKSPHGSALPLQQQISDIITRIPAPITLVSSPTSGSDADAAAKGSQPSATAPSKTVRTHKRRSSLQEALARYRSSTPSSKNISALTLAPADEATSKRSGANDPEIKLYHLTQPGSTKPVKLFIRRVGENSERVMVRVGGGWADLGEYLRAFVEHHSRVVSSGNASVMNETTPGSNGKRQSSFTSTPGSSSRSGTPAPDSFISGPVGTSTPRLSSEDMSALTTPPVYAGGGAAAVSAPNSPLEPYAPLAGSGTRKASSGSRDTATVGLAGPARRAKARDMSDEKREWVDGIVEQARRTVSGTLGTGHAGGAAAATGKGETEERRAPSRLGGNFKKMELGALGEAGKAGTRRVFLRGME